jgi:hypothetical protein
LVFFSGQKYGSAAARALTQLKADGVISSSDSLQMQRAAILDPTNYAYGKQLVKTRAANSADAAAAAVFAQLAVVAEGWSDAPVAHRLWAIAARAALANAGAGGQEIEPVLDGLKKLERDAGWGKDRSEGGQ